MAMHYALHDRHKLKALIAEGVLLTASVLFCATTFAGDEVYRLFGLDPRSSRILLGVASVLAFMAALLSMLIDWRGAAARHKDGAERWSGVVRLFRENQSDDETWPDDKIEQLSHAYWDAAKNSIAIPDRQFNSLKAQYLLKIEISKWAEKYPGAPRVFLWGIAKALGTIKFIKGELGHNDAGGP